MSFKFRLLLIATALSLPLQRGFAEEQNSSLVPSEAPIAQEESTQEPKAPEVPEQPFASFTGKITGNKVRLRAQPTLEGYVVKETHAGEVFAIVGLQNDFYAVQAPKGMKGYVFRTFILEGTVEGDRVNVRLHPDMEAPVVGRLRSGEKVKAELCQDNNKWYEIDLPATSQFFVAKDYVENIGSIELYAKLEEKRLEAQHHLNSALLYCRAELQKPFEEIDLDSIQKRFQKVQSDYSDSQEVLAKIQEAISSTQDTYVQKKIAFLESRADRVTASNQSIAYEAPRAHTPEVSASSEKSASSVQNIVSVLTDKMLAWVPFEQSLYQMWAVSHEGQSMDDFYSQELQDGKILTGIVEPFTRPVKNRPGDYILRGEVLPVFLYSTKVNLQEFVGKKITVVASPRPNNHFAYDAFYVHSAE